MKIAFGFFSRLIWICEFECKKREIKFKTVFLSLYLYSFSWTVARVNDKHSRQATLKLKLEHIVNTP